jgi:hypothetical protein
MNQKSSRFVTLAWKRRIYLTEQPLMKATHKPSRRHILGFTSAATLAGLVGWQFTSENSEPGKSAISPGAAENENPAVSQGPPAQATAHSQWQAQQGADFALAGGGVLTLQNVGELQECGDSRGQFRSYSLLFQLKRGSCETGMHVLESRDVGQRELYLTQIASRKDRIILEAVCSYAVG